MKVHPHALLPALVPLLWACAQDRARPDPDDPAGHPPETSSAPSTCAETADRPAAFAPLAEHVSTVYGFGACGHLAWRAGDTLWRADPDLSTPVETAPGVHRAAFAPDGARLAYTTEAGVRVLHLGEAGTDELTAEGATRFGWTTANGGPRLWACGDGRLRLAGGESLAEAVECPGVVAATGGPHLVFRDTDGGLNAVDLAGGGVRALAGVPAPPAVDEADGYAQRALDLSPDGRVLVIRDDLWAYCGDTVCLRPDGQTHLVDTGTGRLIGQLDARSPEEAFGPGPEPAFLHAGEGHALLFNGRDGGAWMLGADLTLRHIPDLYAWRLFRDGHTGLGTHRPDGERFSGFVRFDAATTELEPLADAAEGAAVSADERTLALSWFTGDCVRYPDRENVCHRQIWALSRWTVATGLTPVVFSDQPLRAYWVGDDGTLLAGGGVYTSPVPQAATPEDSAPQASGLHVIGPDGKIRGTLGEEGRPEIHVAGDRLLVVRWIDRRFVLDVVNPSTGAARRLLEGDRIEVAVGPAGRRMMARVERTGAGGETTRTLWAGAVPRR